jgi:branched-chain amino acid transport system permease protein
MFALLVLAVLLGSAVVVANVRRGDLGQQMLAVRSNERAAAGVGISPARVKLLAFGIAGVIMALAGVLYGYNFGNLDPSRFTAFNTLSLVAFAYLGGITTIRGAAIGGLMITQGLISYALDDLLSISVTFQLVLAGVLLVFTVITNPEGIALTPSPQWLGRLRRGRPAERFVPAEEGNR